MPCFIFSLAPPKYDLKFNQSDVEIWPRTKTSLTFFVNQASAKHGDIKKYGVYAIYYGQQNPGVATSRKRRETSMIKEGTWRDTLKNRLIKYFDHQFTPSQDDDHLEVTIGEAEGKPLQEDSYYSIILQAYTVGISLGDRMRISRVSNDYLLLLFLVKEMELKTKLLG